MFSNSDSKKSVQMRSMSDRTSTTAVFYHRYVQTRRTDTFSMILGGPGHVKSMAKKSKIFPGAPFFKIPFFWGLLVQAIKFSLFSNSSLVLLVTFKRIELEMPD